MAHQNRHELALRELQHTIEQIRNYRAWREHFGVLAEMQEELERSEQQAAVAESAA